MDPDAPSPAPAAAHPPPPRPPGDAASVPVREDRGGDATSEKAAGESESDVRARVGGGRRRRQPGDRCGDPEHLHVQGRQRGRSAGRRCRGGGGGGRRRARRRRLPVALRRRLPRRWPWRWPHWQRLHLPPPQLPLLHWSKENGNREEKNAMRTRIKKREWTMKKHTRGRAVRCLAAAPLAAATSAATAVAPPVATTLTAGVAAKKKKRRRRRM